MTDADGKPAMKPFWEITEGDVEAALAATTWYPANRGYFRGGGYSSQFVSRGGMPVTMARLNLVSGVGPVLQIAEGWTVELPKEVHDVLDQRTDPTWPTHWFVPRTNGVGPFRDVYTVMANWAANHGAISYGHIGADLISLASILRIPVHMHNVPEEDVFRPSRVGQPRHRRPRGRGLPRLRQLRPALRAQVAPNPLLRLGPRSVTDGAGVLSYLAGTATGPPLERRMTSSVGRTTSWAGPSGFARRSRSTATARRPISTAGWATTVRNGNVTIACGRSSKPTTATSSGTARPSSSSACRTPMAMKLLAANSAVGRGTGAIADSVMARPLSIENAPCSTDGAGRPASSTSALVKPATRSTAVGTVCRAREHRHAAMAQAHEQPPELERAALGVGPDDVRPLGLRAPVNDHQRDAAVAAGADGLLAGAGRDDQQAVDLPLQEHRDQPPLLVLALVAVGEEQRDARLARRRLDALRERREERVRHVRQEERDRVRPPRPEVAGERVRHVAGLRERLLDAGAERGAHRPGPVHDARHGHRRDAGAPRDVEQVGQRA